jgi:hypothetical protein
MEDLEVDGGDTIKMDIKGMEWDGVDCIDLNQN